MDNFFAPATPEQVGIQSSHVKRFMDRLSKFNVSMHSIILVRYGKVVAETYYAPYTANTLHRMFSVTKSFTALAIGLLADEGKLSLDDKIVDRFPEKLPTTGVHPYIEQITIRDMLMMATAHAKTTYKGWPSDDWVESFFHVEPSHLPGTVFSYDTSSSHTLAALVEKISGKSVLDYLRTQFLDEIGFSKEAYAITDPLGITQGGSGLMATPLDLAKVAWIVLRKGEYQGRQYLPKEFLQAAVSKQIDTSIKGMNMDERQGYGYQFWRVRNNGYAMFGMGGQLAVCFPDKDLLLVTTADTQEHPCGVPIIFDSFFDEIFENLQDEPLPENQVEVEELQRVCANNQILPEVGIKNDEFQSHIGNKEFRFDSNAMGLEKIKLVFGESEGVLTFSNKTGWHQLKFGLEKLVLSQFPHYGMKCASSAAWNSRNSIIIKSHIIDEELGMIIIQLVFKADTVTVFMKKVIGTAFNEFSGFASGTHANLD